MSQPDSRLQQTALIAEITAALGVILSVIYLAVQVGGSTNALRAQTHHNLLSQANEPILLSINNPELAEIIRLGEADPGQLSESEWSRFAEYQLIAINSWEYGYYLNRDGSAPPELWEGLNAYYANIAANRPGLKRFWGEMSFVYAEPFNSYADQYFEAPLEN